MSNQTPFAYQVEDRITVKYVPKVVTETFQYIPVLDVLKLILKPDVQNLIDREKTLPSGYLRGYQDGQQYKQHGIF
jgi:hypothetical protein